MRTALVVVSHYNAWPTDHLVALLDQLVTVPAGREFRCRVVVNQAQPKPLELPGRFAEVEVLYRPNTGYNIGAWDHGWRAGPAYDDYLFLQEECQVLRPGWLKAFTARLANAKVGLVGESLNHAGYSWRRAEYYFHKKSEPHFVDRRPDAEGETLMLHAVREVMAKRQIPLTGNITHLQSLVLATRREVLEAIDGFMIFNSYGYAVGAEISISKQVEALGLRVEQLGLRPFRYILHPQWRHRAAGFRPVLFGWIEPYLPYRIGAYFQEHPRWHRRVLGRWKRALMGRLRPASPD